MKNSYLKRASILATTVFAGTLAVSALAFAQGESGNAPTTADKSQQAGDKSKDAKKPNHAAHHSKSKEAKPQDPNSPDAPK